MKSQSIGIFKCIVGVILTVESDMQKAKQYKTFIPDYTERYNSRLCLNNL